MAELVRQVGVAASVLDTVMRVSWFVGAVGAACALAGVAGFVSAQRGDRS